MKKESTDMSSTEQATGEAASRLIDQRIVDLGGWRGETLARMRALILEADPEIAEEWKWRGTPVWSRHGIVCTGESYAKVVKLTFARGASIPDPSRLFNSSLEGNTRRAIDIHEGEKVDAGAFKALVKAAVARNVPPAKERLTYMTMKTMKRAIFCGAVLLLLSPAMRAQKTAWRQATDAELASLLPARAPVEKEHIETEMRTASGIVNRRGHFIAGVVLITAGYSANGKYSHYLIVQAPVRIGAIAFQPGEYVFGWDRSGDSALSVHFNKAATGELVGTTDAHLIAASSRVTSLHIWPPGDKAGIQIGRFSIPYELGDD